MLETGVCTCVPAKPELLVCCVGSYSAGVGSYSAGTATPSVPGLDDVLDCWLICVKDVVVAVQGSLRTRLPLATASLRSTRASVIFLIHSHGRLVSLPHSLAGTGD